MSAFEIGDIVHVKGVVEGLALNTKNHVVVLFEPSDSALVHVDRIVHVEPRPTKVGDSVRWKSNRVHLGTVLAVDGDQLWVKTDAKMRSTFTAADLEAE